MKKSLYTLFTLFAVSILSGCCRTENPATVIITTSVGEITATVDTAHAPVSAKNFLKLVDEGAYNRGAAFYRVVRPDNQPNNDVKIEVIQGGLRGGSPAGQLTPIAHETTATTGLQHLDGTLSMARSEPGSATSEFFICIGDQPELDFGGRRNPDGQGFAAFGQVTSGMEVVGKIQQMQDAEQYLTEPVKILSVERAK